MANYGFKTSNESPLQHEMRKENATKWKPSPQQPMGKGGCHVRREERDEATQPQAGSQEHSREPPYPGAHGGPHRDGGCDASGRSQEPVSPRGQFSAEEILLRQGWGQPELCHLAAVSQRAPCHRFI